VEQPLDSELFRPRLEPALSSQVAPLKLRVVVDRGHRSSSGPSGVFPKRQHPVGRPSNAAGSAVRCPRSSSWHAPRPTGRRTRPSRTCRSRPRCQCQSLERQQPIGR
jgi:hypothetical protein